MLREILPDTQAPSQSVVLYGTIYSLLELADPAADLARRCAIRPLPKATLMEQWLTELRHVIIHKDWFDNSASALLVDTLGRPSSRS